jgi:hypothetical protein
MVDAGVRGMMPVMECGARSPTQPPFILMKVDQRRLHADEDQVGKINPRKAQQENGAYKDERTRRQRLQEMQTRSDSQSIVRAASDGSCGAL